MNTPDATQPVTLRDAIAAIEDAMAPLLVPTSRELARKLGIGYRTLARVIESSKDFPPRRCLPGMSTPVYVWAEVREWALSQPREFH